MRNEIILIGPMLAGKSTVAAVISDYFKVPVISLDKVKWEYFSKYGLTHSALDNLLENEGIDGMMARCNPYEALIVEDVLINYKDCIFDFGAGFSIYKDESCQYKINQLLHEYANIFLILPTDDKNTNKKILSNRLKDRLRNDPGLAKYYISLYELSLYFLEHPANSMLAKHVIYTHGLSETQLLKKITTLIV